MFTSRSNGVDLDKVLLEGVFRGSHNAVAVVQYLDTTIFGNERCRLSQE